VIVPYVLVWINYDSIAQFLACADARAPKVWVIVLSSNEDPTFFFLVPRRVWNFSNGCLGETFNSIADNVSIVNRGKVNEEDIIFDDDTAFDRFYLFGV
jgi:hypothetical protein